VGLLSTLGIENLNQNVRVLNILPCNLLNDADVGNNILV